MPLVDALPYGEGLRDDPPVRLDLEGVVVPSDVELTLVGTIHDGSSSSADYAAELFEQNYALLMESFGWDADLQKRFQRISRGYAQALEQDRALNESAIRSGTAMQRNNALWNRSVSDALYKSGIRVVTADVSQADIDSGRFTDMPTHLQAVRAFTENAILGFPILEREMVEFASRDEHIIRAICQGIETLRRQDTKLDPEATLQAAGMYGTLHVKSLADNLAALAAAQGNDSFNVSTQYEIAMPGPDSGLTAETMEDRRVSTARMIRFYDEWLRTQPVAPDALWHTTERD